MSSGKCRSESSPSLKKDIQIGARLREQGALDVIARASSSGIKGSAEMAWKAPKIVEVSVGMEINMYMCATRK